MRGRSDCVPLPPNLRWESDIRRGYSGRFFDSSNIRPMSWPKIPIATSWLSPRNQDHDHQRWIPRTVSPKSRVFAMIHAP